MMKKTFLTLLCVLSTTWAFADPHDCLSKSEAESLATKITNQYIIDYCDCCDSVNPDANILLTSAKLLYITKATVVPCSYDVSRYSVKIEYDFSGAYVVDKGILKGKNMAKEASEGMKISKHVSLNYHFYLKDKTAERLYGILNKEVESAKCDGLNRFPTAKETKDKKYKSFLSKK